MDLIREAGVGGFVSDYFAGASMGKGAKGMAGVLGTGFTALNTIEEEKHETQTSNYFRDAAGGAGGVITESERDYDNTHLRGSKILDDPDLINTSSKHGSSPRRGGETDFDFPKHHSSAKQSTKAKASDILVEHGTPGKSGGKKRKNLIRSDEKQVKKRMDDDDDEYEQDQEEDEEDDYAQDLQKDNIKYDEAEDEDEDDYEEDINEEVGDDAKENKKKEEPDEEHESDYEF